jgi:hypothetical protein
MVDTGPGDAARCGQAPPGDTQPQRITQAPASQPRIAGGTSTSRARAASRYPEGASAGVAGGSDQLPQAVQASRSCDRPRNE